MVVTVRHGSVLQMCKWSTIQPSGFSFTRSATSSPKFSAKIPHAEILLLKIQGTWNILPGQFRRARATTRFVRFKVLSFLSFGRHHSFTQSSAVFYRRRAFLLRRRTMNDGGGGNQHQPKWIFISPKLSEWKWARGSRSTFVLRSIVRTRMSRYNGSENLR